MQRIARWLWHARSPMARLTRAGLLPASHVYLRAMRARTAAYRRGLLRSHRLPAPSVAVGNLVVGGSGKTPLASWIATHFAQRGLAPGILMRGYGGDEGDIHRSLVPTAIVVEHPDRRVGAARAVERGAKVLVLDDAFQRLDIVRDINIAVMGVEWSEAAQWTLPAGPWREDWASLDRADFVVVTRKIADLAAADEVVRSVVRISPQVPTAIAQLRITGFWGLSTGLRYPLGTLNGAHVVVSAGIADPGTFAAQCSRLGAAVMQRPWPDHHRYSQADIESLLHLSTRVDYVVVTRKDALKLAAVWPRGAPEPLVAELSVQWDRGGAALTKALDTLVHPNTQPR